MSIEALNKACQQAAEAASELLKSNPLPAGGSNLSAKQIIGARREGILTKEEARQMHGEAHHAAYTRTSASGAVSNIKQLGSDPNEVDGITPAKAMLYKTAVIKETGQHVSVRGAGHMMHNPETNRMEHAFNVTGIGGVQMGKLPQSVMHRFVL